MTVEITEEQLEAVGLPAIPGVLISVLSLAIAEMPISADDFAGLASWPTEAREHFVAELRKDLGNVRGWAEATRDALDEAVPA